MNTKSLSTKMYLALSVLITGIMGLVGCGVIKFVAVEAKAGAANPADVEEVGVNVIETGFEPIGSPEAPAPTDQPPPISSDDELIRAALGAHLGVDGNALAMAVLLNTGSRARGNVENGYFIAAKIGEEWVIVADGQEMPDCNKVERYGFPASMVPECEFPTVSSAGSDEEDIRAALAAHFGVDGSALRVSIKQNTGSHARGGVDNGYFLAAKINGQWVFVDGGHAAPNCNEVAKYGFPASMVPWCPTGGSNAPDCPGNGTTVATFIADVTYPDGTIVSPGQSFLKTWRIKNVGTCTWNSEYQLVFESGDAMSGPAHQQLTEIHIPPGETLDISVQLTAPETSGTYRGNWKLRSPHGDIFGTTTGNPIWVEIEVVTSDSEDEENQSSNTGCPTIQITDVNEDQNVTIRGLNFPPNDTFNVLLNYSDTLGIDGKLVTTVKTGASGEFTDTYTIPAFLQGQDTIAIRLESPTSGYYAYNWFYNL